MDAGSITNMEDKLAPKQTKFLKLYLTPGTEYFGNAYSSAIQAEYSESYARNLTHLLPEWLSENIGNLEVLKKAETKLKETLDLNYKDEKDKVDVNLLRIIIDVAKFVAETIGKVKYSKKTEVEQSGKIEHELKTDEDTKELVKGYIAWLKEEAKNPPTKL